MCFFLFCFVGCSIVSILIEPKRTHYMSYVFIKTFETTVCRRQFEWIKGVAFRSMAWFCCCFLLLLILFHFLLLTFTYFIPNTNMDVSNLWYPLCCYFFYLNFCHTRKQKNRPNKFERNRCFVDPVSDCSWYCYYFIQRYIYILINEIKYFVNICFIFFLLNINIIFFICQ